MIVKSKKFPRDIEQLQSLERRLPPGHSQRLEVGKNLSIRLAGYKGEISLRYPLSFLPDDYLIFQDLRLNDGSHFFQIDTLILTCRFILLIEVKNIAGHLHFDQHFNQLTRTLNDEQQGFADPILQVERHRRQLQKWLHLHQLSTPPIHCMVTSSNPQSILSSNDPHLKMVVRSENLPEKISELSETSSKIVLSKSQLDALISCLLDHDTPLVFEPLALFNIHPDVIQCGVFCSSCKSLFMKRTHGGWKCSHCFHYDKQAHLAAIRDYFLLFGPTITNPKLRHFLCIDSKFTAHRILLSLRTERIGAKKGTRYRLLYDD